MVQQKIDHDIAVEDAIWIQQAIVSTWDTNEGKECELDQRKA